MNGICKLNYPARYALDLFEIKKSSQGKFFENTNSLPHKMQISWKVENKSWCDFAKKT